MYKHVTLSICMNLIQSYVPYCHFQTTALLHAHRNSLIGVRICSISLTSAYTFTYTNTSSEATAPVSVNSFIPNYSQIYYKLAILLNPHLLLQSGFCFHKFVDTGVRRDFYVIKSKDFFFFGSCFNS